MRFRTKPHWIKVWLIRNLLTIKYIFLSAENLATMAPRRLPSDQAALRAMTTRSVNSKQANKSRNID